MNTAIELFYAPIQPFLRHPERAYFWAALFVLLLLMSLAAARKFKPQHGTILIAAILWGLFGLNEQQAEANGWNLRVDILLSWPILLVTSMAAVRAVELRRIGKEN